MVNPPEDQPRVRFRGLVFKLADPDAIVQLCDYAYKHGLVLMPGEEWIQLVIPLTGCDIKQAS